VMLAGRSLDLVPGHLFADRRATGGAMTMAVVNFCRPEYVWLLMWRHPLSRILGNIKAARPDA
jgi:hypothetical protein